MIVKILFWTCLIFGPVFSQIDVHKMIDSLDGNNYLEVLEDVERELQKVDYDSLDKAFIYSDVAAALFKVDSLNEQFLNYSKKAIRMGYTGIMLLANKSGLFLKNSNFQAYQSLWLLSDSVFLAKNKNVNVALALIIRRLFQRDQEIRTVLNNIKDKALEDSIYREMQVIDAFNEEMVGVIFDHYGYPGYSLVGEESQSCYIMMHHFSINFQLKYFHLLYEAKLEGDLWVNLDFLEDKILYNAFKHPIHGTHWSTDKKELDEKVIEKYRKKLKIKFDL